MLGYNLQLFGGRGSSGGNNPEGNKATAAETASTTVASTTEKAPKQKIIQPTLRELEQGVRDGKFYISSNGSVYRGNGGNAYDGAYTVTTAKGHTLSGRTADQVRSRLDQGKITFVASGDISIIPVGNVYNYGGDTYIKVAKNKWEVVDRRGVKTTYTDSWMKRIW